MCSILNIGKVGSIITYNVGFVFSSAFLVNPAYVNSYVWRDKLDVYHTCIFFMHLKIQVQKKFPEENKKYI